MGGQNLLVRRILFGVKIFFMFYEKNFRTRSQTLFEKKKVLHKRSKHLLLKIALVFWNFLRVFNKVVHDELS